MQSAFGPKRGNPQATAQPAVEETYDLKGLDRITPDDIMMAGRSPWTINSRMRARNDGENRVANRTRKGSANLSTPVGQTADVQNVTGNTGDLAFSTTSVIAQPIVPSTTAALTRLDTSIKKIGAATGHIIVEIYTNNGGIPGTMIAQGSILANVVTTSYAYLTAYFIDAPTLTSGVTYWAVYYIQDNGSGSYYLSQTNQVGAADLLSNSVATGAWNTIPNSINYKTFLSTPGGVTGFHLRYPSDGNNRIIFSQLGNVYAVPKNTGVATSIDSGLNASATKYRFCQVQDKTIYCNGFDPLRWYDGTTATAVNNVPTAVPTHVIPWKNRLFVVSAGNRIDFSDLLNYESYPSVNFFYVPDPLSPDKVAGGIVFQDNLVLLTHKTKHVIIGSDISNFTRKESVGTKGAVSQEAIASDRNFVYFMADDLMIYRWNGVSDQMISDLVQPILQTIADPNSVRFNIYRNQLRISFAQSPSAFANMTLVYDIPLGEWFLDTGHPVTGYSSLYLDKNELVEFSSVVGRVMYGEAQGSDLGKMIDWKFWTNYKTYAYRRRTGQTFGGGSAKKRIKRFRPVVRIQNANYTMYVGKDMNFANTPDMRPYTVSGGGATWGGGGKWGDGSKYGSPKQLQNRSAMSGRGEHIQYRFERKGVETPVELYGYIAQYKVGKQK